MKAYDILEQAARQATGSPPDPLITKTGAGLINTVLYDMGCKAIVSLADQTDFLSLGESRAVIGGVSMLICTLLGDDAGAASWSAVYQSAKNRARQGISRVKNTLFGGGEDEA